MKWRVLPILLLVAPAVVTSQVLPSPGSGDPRLQTVVYKSDQIVTVAVAPGYQVLIELAPDEQIQNIALGDTSAWQATASKQGNRLYVKSTQPGVDTNMTVVTNTRFYGFDLTSASNAEPAPYKISFRYPDNREEATGPDSTPIVGRYHLHGDAGLRPGRIFDDGAKTYIEWPQAMSLPAVFLVDDARRESVANGAMRGNVYVIDDVSSHLMFRIDQRIVRADRYQLRRR